MPRPPTQLIKIEQKTPSRIPHKESSEIFEIKKEREQCEEGIAKARKTRRARLELTVPLQALSFLKGNLPSYKTDFSSRSQKISGFNWLK